MLYLHIEQFRSLLRWLSRWVIPTELIAAERKKVFTRVAQNYGLATPIEIKERARMDTMGEWQRRCSVWDRDRWTPRLTGDLNVWVSMGHGKVNFYFT